MAPLPSKKRRRLNKFPSLLDHLQEYADDRHSGMLNLVVSDAAADWLKKNKNIYHRAPKDVLKRSVSDALDGADVQLVDVKPTNTLNDTMVSTYRKETPAPSPAKKRVKQTEDGYLTPRPSVRYSDIGGLDHVIQDIRELIERPITHPEVYAHLGLQPPRGVLLCGPPGSGKTLLANAIGGELGIPYYAISAPEVVSGMSGESEAKIRDLFYEAQSNAPCIIFIDEVDSITPKRETASRQMDQRIVTQLMTCMDGLSPEHTRDGKPVIVLAATNRPSSLDAALRRAGRFDREIMLGIPDEAARGKILSVFTRDVKISGPIILNDLAKMTPGYVGADLDALVREAGNHAINRIFTQLGPDATTTTLSESVLEPLGIEMADFLHGLKVVQPSAKREGFSTVPNVTWDDVGALCDVRRELEASIMHPIRHPEHFEALGLKTHAGVLLYGPPGCGKTLVAKAIARESGASFISVKGPELLNKYVGESERAVRVVFERARASAPCIIFFDEIDALAVRRGGANSSQSSERVVNQLLTEMDGLEDRRSVYVIGATNRHELLDPAILRPGRLDRMVYVPLPDANSRLSIMEALTRRTPLKDVDLKEVVDDVRCDGMSGADLSGVVREACLEALHRSAVPTDDLDADSVVVVQVDFDTALDRCRSSVSKQDARHYHKLQLE